MMERSSPLQTPIHPAELCQMGIAALHFDPTGRGKAGARRTLGAQNIKIWFRTAQCPNGRRSDRFQTVYNHSHFTRHFNGSWWGDPAKRPPVLVLDWEGPSDREIMTSGGTQWP